MRLYQVIRHNATARGYEHTETDTIIRPQYNPKACAYDYLVFMPTSRPVRKLGTYAELCLYLAIFNVPLDGWQVF